MLRRIVTGLLLVVVLLLAGFALFVASRQNLKFDAPYPAVVASTDSAVIARGHYVVRVVANCQTCHGDPQLAKGTAGTYTELPLAGGYEFNIPPGRFRVRNLTPDSATGLGAVSDGAIARALRNGIGHDGRALLPFMEMQGLSDEDLVAVVSYLRTQAPVHNPVPMHEYNLLGRIVRATLLANPVGPSSPPPQKNPSGPTLENGRYLAESVALCWACHTERDYKTGQLIGPRYGGSPTFDQITDGHGWAPPNITSDPETGRLGAMTEQDFLNRMHTGQLIPGSPMPWAHYARMSDDDLRAIYLFLKSLPPVKRDVGPPVVPLKPN